MVGHTIVISANLLHLYIKVESVEEVQELEESCLSGPWHQTRSTTIGLSTPAITITGKKEKRKGRKKDRHSWIVSVMARVMSNN